MEWLIGLILAALPLAILLACPVGMVLAMRMMGGRHDGAAIADPQKLGPVRRLEVLERRQAELAQQIALARRELEGQPAAPAREVTPAERG